MYRRILAGFDDSSYSRLALEHAVELARASEGELTVISVARSHRPGRWAARRRWRSIFGANDPGASFECRLDGRRAAVGELFSGSA